MKFNLKPTAFAILTATALSSASALAENNWTVRATLGYSALSDQSGQADNVDAGVSSADSSVSGGFVSGLGLMYHYNPNWAAEIGWEYRTNDAETTLDNGDVYKDGNYASNVFYLNGIYTLDPMSQWQPYLGAGLLWVQEVDIDLEGLGAERSFSQSGDAGYQIFAGLKRSITEDLDWHTEIRYGSITGIDLEEEGGNGQINDYDYQPLTLQLGLDYHF